MAVVSLQDKCYQYWPDQGCWTYGNVRVAVEDFTVLVDYTIRKFCVQNVRLESLSFLTECFFFCCSKNSSRRVLTPFNIK